MTTTDQEPAPTMESLGPPDKFVGNVRLLSNTHLADFIENSNVDLDGMSPVLRVAIVRLLRLNATDVETYFNRLAQFEAANKINQGTVAAYEQAKQI